MKLNSNITTDIPDIKELEANGYYINQEDVPSRSPGPSFVFKRSQVRERLTRPIYLAQRLLTPQTRKHPRLIGSILGFCRLFNSKY